MQIPVLIEPIANNGYRARGFEPLALSADGATSEEALEKLQKLLASRLQNGAKIIPLEVPAKPADSPWRAMAGMYKDDPLFESWQQSIADYRRQVDEDPEIP